MAEIGRNDKLAIYTAKFTTNIKTNNTEVGDKLWMIGFGGGLTYAGVIVAWGK